MLSKDAWLAQVTKHSIFTNLENSRSPSVYRNYRLASHGSELFVSSGDRIRYADVATMTDYFELDIKEIDFEIKHILLNSSRSLLVASSTSKMVAVFLPRGSRRVRQELRAHVIGEEDYVSTEIVRIAIHPHCSANTSITVLTADGFLRLYDLNTSFTSADLAVDLLPIGVRRSRRLKFHGDLENSEPSDFCFGTGGDGWTAFTVFVLMRNGDLVSVCPFLPPGCQVLDHDMELFESHAGELGQSGANASYRLLQAIERGNRTTLGSIFARPVKFPNPTVSSPFLICPAPLEFTTQESVATGLCFIPSQPVNLLAIASNEKIDICLLTDAIVPKAGQECCLSLHESIALPNSNLSLVNLPNVDQNTSFFIAHDDGLHVVETRHWQHELLAAFDGCDDGQIRDAATEGISSEVTLLLDCVGLRPIDVIHLDSEAGSAILLMSSDHKAHAVAVDDISSETSEAGEGTNDEIALDNEVPELTYQSLLSAPAYRAQPGSRGTKIVTPVGISHRTIQSDVESLQFLTKYVMQTRKELETLMNAFIAMHRRIALQEKEFERQQIKLASLHSTLDRLASRSCAEAGLLKERQNDLERRFAKVSQELMNNHAPKLSDAEKRYFSELERMRKLASGPRGLLKRSSAADQQYKHIKQMLAVLQPPSEGSEQDIAQSPFHSNQLSKIKVQLECNEEILAKLKSKTERLTRLSLNT